MQMGSWVPIRRHEWKRFVLLLATLTALTCNNKILKILKDALVVTAPDSGAEVIPFLKTWVLIPVALLLIAVFDRLSRRYTREQVFYQMTLGFLAFFMGFVLVLYPNRGGLHPHALCDSLDLILPPAFRGFILILRHWTLSLFYVMCDMWSTLLISLVFWNFVGGVVTLDEAKRFYGFFSLDFAGVIAGILVGLATGAGLSGAAFESSLVILIFLVVLIGLFQMACFRAFHRLYPVGEKPRQETEAKPKVSWREKLGYFAKHPYSAYLAITVLCFEFTDNLVDVIWKAQLGALCQDPGDFSLYAGWVTFATGLIGCAVVLLISSVTLRRMSWQFNAVITPAAILIMSTLFFGFLLDESLAVNAAAMMGCEPLQLVVLIGAVQSVVMQVSKYTFFDNTKELAFLVIGDKERPKAKAYGDAFAARVGKSGSSLSHQGLLMLLLTLKAATPYVAVLVIGGATLWLWATLRLGTQVEHRMVLQENLAT